ncbi:hypothetical protein A7U60_g8526 [Sanghuangporus baumii]|uniref:AAA+ ATPase domain-containing protein n=1 Tax=Sanghuangporus baumii TaxID=108892 RepID=A0A9Q5MYB8_SANBA|nr:hypothetical protein A7U60_g8526 [Sanghuangporus baumii]
MSASIFPTLTNDEISARLHKLLTPESTTPNDESGSEPPCSSDEDLSPSKAKRRSEYELLRPQETNSRDSAIERHDHLTAPLLTSEAHEAVGLAANGSQYGLLGQILSIHNKGQSVNAPLSVLVCGVQGSGKSHTVACMLESMFIEADDRIGTLSKSLSGLVLHMSDGGSTSNPNETAWVGLPKDLASKAPRVVVYVSPSSLRTMTKVYAHLGPNVNVKPLYFTEDELDAQAFLSMMAVGGSDGAPLYIQIILSILRELGENYSYRAFQEMLNEKRRTFNPAQAAGLEQRMALLESFMSKGKMREKQSRRFRAGQLTIVDLSDPFIDPASACGIFEIIVRLFVRAKVDTGKVLVVDEAHKYLAAKNGSTGLTQALLTLIQPTVVPPVLIDLCSVAVMHRFSSPSWYEHIIKHVSADLSSSDAFDRVVKLQTGEAVVLAPSGLCMSGSSEDEAEQIGRRYLIVRTRRRITQDGGSSIMVI